MSNVTPEQELVEVYFKTDDPDKVTPGRVSKAWFDDNKSKGWVLAERHRSSSTAKEGGSK